MDITSQEFERRLKEESSLCRKWTELEVGKVYTLMGNRMVDTKYRESMILLLKNYGAVWAPNHLKKRLSDDHNFPKYIKPKRLVKCKNSLNKYHG